jgi:hypothetical protein
MPRYFTRPSVVPDELIVAGKRLAGEDPRAAAIATALRTKADPTPVLLGQGVAWLVVDREASRPAPTIPGLTLVFSGPSVAVYRLDGQPTPQPDRSWSVAAVLAAWLVAAGLVAAAVLRLIIRRHAW